MKKWIFAALAMSVLALPAAAQGFGGGNSGGNNSPALVLYPEANYGGTGIAVTGALSALGRETNMNDKTSSLKVTGSWEICTDGSFKGRCVTIAQDVPDLKTLKMNNNISSVRPSTGFGGGNGGEQGSNVTRYDDPRWQGVPIFYCGKSIANCGKPNAKAFCELVGHSDAMTYSAGQRTSSRGYVPVDRSYQSGGMMFSTISCTGASTGGPGFGGGAQPSVNYPNPDYQGAPIAYCGKGGGNCGEPNANAFCKNLGHTGSVSYTEGSQSKFQVYSPSELSFRSGGRTFRAISCAGTSSGGGPGFGGGSGGSSGGNSQAFDAPTLNGMRVNSCGKAANSCGKVSADAFCRVQGFGSSSSHKLLNGLTGPLVSPTDNSIALAGQAFDSVLCIR
ncbi:MAG: beta/gamma crystallin-related protein [Hyphomonas sp.]|nr:beta/gamma crystallin-related protein [Hyphomonas sp.]